MTDPFGLVGSTPRAHDDPSGSPTYDDDGPGDVRVPCQCGAMLTRRRIPPYDWVHEDDETIIRGDVVISASHYDHTPVLNVIDL